MSELKRYRTMVSDNALWVDFPFRADDIVISPPAKCGTSWMQMLCALLIFDTPRFHRPLTEISPWLDATTYDFTATVATLEAQKHRRFIKTHTPLDGLPIVEGVTYICVGRDPRDVAISFDHAMANVAPEAMQKAAAMVGLGPDDAPPPPPEDPVERFRIWADAEFINGPDGMGATMANMIHHLQTYWDRRHEPHVVLFHYHELLADLPGQMRRLADALGIDVTTERIEQLAAEAAFDRMRDRADELAPGLDSNIWRSNRAFFHSGTSGQWRGLLGPDDIRHYQDRLAELASPDLIDWLHTGSAGGPDR
ncbi:sulfotransferase domain-containing protein [Allorhizocola rhizosphaerae]|uniref:sulfotransferase domain-containing protein n=1 Tax=Allorhizocola rhizosphaerae TaxID=1872709 RepID=UPI0013C2F9AC|nr:sulfotransferase domain-containing protein [Allorhizocola rhizosphaerae]